MFVVGVDENGLGPVLGALISTAVTLEVEAYDPARLRTLGLRSGLTDSKKSGGFGRMALCESVALALVESLSGDGDGEARGEACGDVDALLERIAELGLAPLVAPCPRTTRAQCWGHPLALPAYGGSAAHGRALLAALRDGGVVPVRARTVVSCAGVLNAQLERGVNKLAVNLAAFERLVLDARAATTGELLAVCGMIGGSAVSNLIREGKTFQLVSVMQTGKTLGMQTMNEHLIELVKSDLVEAKEAYIKSNDKVGMKELFKRNNIKLDLA